MTTIEAADLLGVQRHAVLMAISRGKLKAVKIGRDWRITSKAVRDYQKHLERIGRLKLGGKE